MKISAQGPALAAASQRAAGGQKGVGSSFKELVQEEEARQVEPEGESEQARTLKSLERENRLHGLSSLEQGIRQRVNNPRLVSIHRRILPDGSCMICEKSGSGMVSHYTKRLNLGQPEKNVDIRM